MEFWLGLGLAFVGAIFFIWRGRRGTSSGPDTLNKGLPDDLRDKNTGLGSMPNDGRPWGGGT